MRERSVVRLWVTPSTKYSCSRSPPRLAKGRTTMDRRGAGGGSALMFDHSLRDGRRKDIATPRRSLYDALIAVAQRQSHFADALCQRFIRHNDARPDGLDQLVLGYQSAGVLDEITQHLKAFRPEVDLSIG